MTMQKAYINLGDFPVNMLVRSDLIFTLSVPLKEGQKDFRFKTSSRKTQNEWVTRI